MNSASGKKKNKKKDFQSINYKQKHRHIMSLVFVERELELAVGALYSEAPLNMKNSTVIWSVCRRSKVTAGFTVRSLKDLFRQCCLNTVKKVRVCYCG